ncbi:CDP-diacylglycerol--glycerol-3-phosphate 3-phosphatidyltransferase [Orenia metallireducens]|uniref:CDP-diacylglycerol--glycerol-3-phosphate 3-phosphatidyltransferase n=1 Tax=Orenia metallireducens TaxID=1413210 RepID=A0A1C0AAQ9_9FIRM|nr:CDP-diacylglycerol--glycerol-3-phosphate 3-phosphatidyltransferase [Orenia metallireducens]OCL27339.1 CDP-diacylglycerol--glycerol-3-phosphate 3-phosphatidyltransferase [Orenia metallireducens]
MNVANLLTLSRIILLPFFIIIFFSNYENNFMIAGMIFAISGLTDLLDGYVARKYNQVSHLGRLLDPLADKLTMISVFIILAINNSIHRGIIGVILVREFIILIGSCVVYFNSDDIISPSKFGKSATFLLYVTAAAYILNFSIFKYTIFIALPLTIISGVSYCLEAYKFLFKSKNI